jgi:hypothetical protein
VRRDDIGATAMLAALPYARTTERVGNGVREAVRTRKAHTTVRVGVRANAMGSGERGVRGRLTSVRAWFGRW